MERRAVEDRRAERHNLRGYLGDRVGADGVEPFSMSAMTRRRGVVAPLRLASVPLLSKPVERERRDGLKRCWPCCEVGVSAGLHVNVVKAADRLHDRLAGCGG